MGELEELLRGQVERDVGLAVGVEEDRVEALVGAAQVRPRVVGVQAQLRPRPQPEVALADVEQLAVDLDGVDRGLREVVRVRAGGRAGRGAEHRDARRRLGRGRPAGRPGRRPSSRRSAPCRAVERVDRLALVELEAPHAVGVLDHARVLVLGLGLVEHRAASAEPLTVPTGTAISAAMASGTSAHRGRRPSAATAAVISAKMRNVRWVPTSGISSSEAANVPSSEPTVEIAYIRPAISPESSTARIFSRIAHGDTAPSISTGTATSTRTPNSEPANAPIEYSSNASTLSDRNGPATNGTSASSTEATSTARTAPAGSGGGRPSARRTSSRSRARRARSRSCSPTRSSSRRRTAPSAARRRSPRRASRCRPTKTSSSSGGRACPRTSFVARARSRPCGRRRRGRTSRWGCHRRRCPGGIPPSGSPSAGS